MRFEELLRSGSRLSVGRRPEADALGEEDAHQVHAGTASWSSDFRPVAASFR